MFRHFRHIMPQHAHDQEPLGHRNPTVWVVWANTHFASVRCLFFCSLHHMVDWLWQSICHYNDVFPCQGVLFRSFVGGSNLQKTFKRQAWIGIFKPNSQKLKTCMFEITASIRNWSLHNHKTTKSRVPCTKVLSQEIQIFQEMSFCVLQVLLRHFANTLWQLYIDFYTVRIAFASSFQLCILIVANLKKLWQFWQKSVDRTFVHVKHGAVKAPCYW